MHLKQLKLAGFKSFVDPTVVLFPSQLVAVVGPNGCGKSNIIDAVRWVTGESSAKNLRGDSMVDVIFNGSSNRKPVGQASVELVFDNSMGRLSGPFASYGEIAVKRVVTRDGESLYYLNGSRCRRKDITDIFLGTGAGAKGYSIIGQGTISRLIEAKPEELRAFLEEAAGVSKYKERRRETMQRIAHTRENLNRVADIREELDKQLQRLERQAKAAERYTLLKEEEQLCRAEIQALKWQELTEQQVRKQKEVQDLAIHYEQKNTSLTTLQTQKVILNEQVHEVDEQTQEIQTSFYKLGTDIARLEEAIGQQEREKKRLGQDRQQLQEDWQHATQQIKNDKQALIEGELIVEELSKQKEQLKNEFKQKEELSQQQQKQQLTWEKNNQELITKTNTLKNELQLIEVKGRHLEQQKQQNSARLDKLHAELSSFSLSKLQEEWNQLAADETQLKAKQEDDEAQLKQKNEFISSNRQRLQETEQELHRLQDEFHQLNSEHALLVAAQKAMHQADTETSFECDKPRLMEVIRVEPEWQSVCEMVLGTNLKAFVLEALDEFWSQQDAHVVAGAHVVTMKPITREQKKFPRLADKIQGACPASELSLESIYVAENKEQALSWLPSFDDNESVVSKDGFWIAKGWVKVAYSLEKDELGILERQQRIVNLDRLLGQLQEKISSLRSQRDQYHQEVQQHLSSLNELQMNVQESTDALRANILALTSKEEAIEQTKKKITLLNVESEELSHSLEELCTEQVTMHALGSDLEHQLQEQELLQEQFIKDKQNWLSSLNEYTKVVEETRSLMHQVEMQYDREITKIQQLKDRIHREEERLVIVQERLEHLVLLCEQAHSPEASLQEQLSERLAQHTEVELHLTESRERLAQYRLQLDDVDESIINQGQEIKALQEKMNQLRMEEQALAVRAGSIQEALTEQGIQAFHLLDKMAAGITQSMREEELIAITEKIKRLGAINLAAIEEYTSEGQRKLYLDEQHHDLSEALLTLETAIEKMDKETRLRLENTFDEVNTAFKSLFPRLFGGGRAQLELTCDNLLEAGIVVMAQPPGKRNSTIHLLSGGEKAMTAVALVFAIFQLNPSPFCMLDEVDAPLDDVNVGRFCDLVKEMSQFVQFLFITHNKVTMELADHLIGVTMREPGVSRLVAVDVKQALTME